MRVVWLLLCLAQEGPAVDPKLPSYQPSASLEGQLNSVGGAWSLLNMMTLWAESYQKHHPAMKIQIEGQSGFSAMPALISGRSQVAPMNRPVKPEEEQVFRDKFGYSPTGIVVAIDVIGVLVNVDNPLDEITLEQIDGAWSKSRRRKGENIATWGDLGLRGEWTDKPISLYGRNSASSTYAFFKEAALSRGDFKDEVQEQPGTATLIGFVEKDRYGMGYGAVGYGTPKVKALKIVLKAGEKAVPGIATTAWDGTYPLGRRLFLYVNKPEDRPLDPRVREFLRLALSKEGQESVVKDGYLPLTAEQALAQWKKLQ